MSSGLTYRGHLAKREETKSYVLSRDEGDELRRPLLEDDNSDDIMIGGRADNAALSSLTSQRLHPRSESQVVIGHRVMTRWDVALEYGVAACCFVLDHLPSGVALKFANELSAVELRRLDEIKPVFVADFDRANPDHAAQIQELWLVNHQSLNISPITPFPEDGKSELWKTFGFQGVDPATDFRGAGAFSIRNLLYLNEAYPQLYKTMLQCDYPFAAASINCTMILLTLLGLKRAGATCLATTHFHSPTCFSFVQAKTRFARLVAAAALPGDRERIFSEVYCVSMSRLQSKWEKSTKNLMEFNTLLKEVARDMEFILKCAASVEEVMMHAESLR